MVKHAVIILQLLPEANKISNRKLKEMIEKEVEKSIFLIPWANKLESIEIKHQFKMTS